MINTVIQWTLTLTSIAMLWYMGDGSRKGPIIGLASQALWMYYVYSTAQWGLALGTIVFTGVHARNLVKMWRKSEKRK